MYKPYTGVGARNTPKDILDFITKISAELHRRGFTLRSGGAKGADTAFERGVPNGSVHEEIYYANHATQAAEDIARRFHPAWHNCNEYARKLHARNAFQVLGANLNHPSKFLLCWTPDGCTSMKTRTRETGGTGTAIAIADYYAIRIFNLAVPEHTERLQRMLQGHK